MKKNAITAFFSGKNKKKSTFEYAEKLSLKSDDEKISFENMPYISVFVRGNSKHINSCLEKQTYKNFEHICNETSASGDYILILTEDCRFDENMLAVFVSAINEKPNADMFYSDEDRVNSSGQRCAPIFKPDFSSITALSYNSIGLPILISKKVFSKLGKIETDGEDELYSLALKCASISEDIVHISQVLISRTVKKECVSSEGGFRAIKAYLQIKRKVMLMEEGICKGTFNVNFPSKKDDILLVVIVATNATRLRVLLESLEECAFNIEKRIVVVRNKQCDAELLKYCKLLEEIGKVCVVCTDEKNYSKMCNKGAQEADGDILLFIDESMEVVSPFHIQNLMDCASQNDVGMVCPKIVDEQGNLYECGLTMGLLGKYASLYAGEADNKTDEVKNRFVNVKREISAVSSLCFVVKRDVFFSVSGFDETFKTTEATVELSLRIKRKGLKNVYTPFAVVIKHSDDMNMEKSKEDGQRIYGTLRSLLIAGDPFYNANYDYAFSVPKIAMIPYSPIEINAEYNKQKS